MGPRVHVRAAGDRGARRRLALLANGWQVPYADVIDRTACDSPADSFSEFLRSVPVHRALYSLGDNEIIAVLC